MKHHLILSAARERINTSAAQISQALALSPEPAQQFYSTLSYNCRTAAYQAYFARLQEKKSPTAAELEQLIVSEFTCAHDFVTFGPGDDFLRHFERTKNNPNLLKSNADYQIAAAYIKHNNYKKCAALMPPRRSLDNTSYIITQLNSKCLLWQGKFAECYTLLSKCLNPFDEITEELRIFYALQRALCNWHMGNLTNACDDCKFAAEREWVNSPPLRRQLPAILWLQAQIHYAAGDNKSARQYLEELLAANMQVPRQFPRPISVAGQRYIDQYQKIIGAGGK